MIRGLENLTRLKGFDLSLERRRIEGEILSQSSNRGLHKRRWRYSVYWDTGWKEKRWWAQFSSGENPYGCKGKNLDCDNNKDCNGLCREVMESSLALAGSWIRWPWSQKKVVPDDFQTSLPEIPTWNFLCLCKAKGVKSYSHSHTCHFCYGISDHTTRLIGPISQMIRKYFQNWF